MDNLLRNIYEFPVFLDDLEENTRGQSQRPIMLSACHVGELRMAAALSQEKSSPFHNSMFQVKQNNMSSVIFVRKHAVFWKRSRTTFWILFTTFFSCFSQHAFNLSFIVSIHLVLIFISACPVKVSGQHFILFYVFIKSCTFWEDLFIIVKNSTAFGVTFWADQIFNAFFGTL